MVEPNKFLSPGSSCGGCHLSCSMEPVDRSGAGKGRSTKWTKQNKREVAASLPLAHPACLSVVARGYSRSTCGCLQQYKYLLFSASSTKGCTGRYNCCRPHQVQQASTDTYLTASCARRVIHGWRNAKQRRHCSVSRPLSRPRPALALPRAPGVQHTRAGDGTVARFLSARMMKEVSDLSGRETRPFFNAFRRTVTRKPSVLPLSLSLSLSLAFAVRVRRSCMVERQQHEQHEHASTFSNSREGVRESLC